MKMTSLLAAAALAVSLLASPAARATTLLDLANPADQSNTAYSLSFTAASSTTEISIGGYQVLDAEQTTNIGLFENNAGGNLLGAAWNLTPAAPFFSNTYTYNDGTSVSALVFAATAVDAYDIYTQYISTTSGQSYSLNFTYSNGVFFGASSPSGLLVTAGVPEPSTWTLMLLGLAGLGYLGRRRMKPSLMH